MDRVGMIYTDRRMMREKMIRDDEPLVSECSLPARIPQILVTLSASLSWYVIEERSWPCD